MTSVNFIPRRTLEARRRRRRLRAWALGGSAYLALLAGAYAVCFAAWGTGHAAMERRERAARTRIDTTRGTTREVEAVLAERELTLEAKRAVANHPDWSILMMLVARELGDDIVLSHCVLAPQGDPPGPGTARRPTPYLWQMAGYGRTIGAASRFALALERMGLFDHVRLVKTNRQKFLEATAYAFQIECVLGAEGGTAR